MMNDATMLMTMAPAGIVGFGIVSAAMLRAWSGWLEVKRLEVERTGPDEPQTISGGTELRDLKERVRKLEAIANGVDF